ncbi:mucin-2-like [Hylaeus volcanicus]|uniref:mucin-2-like n=1 Tax=Hylaeus volcanicus TaxID=313075 RepID=UPI0023B7D59B|nr:mucin-2-like [Hylaeus volcanicus]
MLNILIFIYLVYLNTFILSHNSNINFSVWEFIQANSRNSSRRLSGNKNTKYQMNRMRRSGMYPSKLITQTTSINNGPFTDPIVAQESFGYNGNNPMTTLKLSSVVSQPSAYPTLVAIPASIDVGERTTNMLPLQTSEMISTTKYTPVGYSGLPNDQSYSTTFINRGSGQMQDSFMMDPRQRGMPNGVAPTLQSTTMISRSPGSTFMAPNPYSAAFSANPANQIPMNTYSTLNTHAFPAGASTTTVMSQGPMTSTTLSSHNSEAISTVYGGSTSTAVVSNNPTSTSMVSHTPTTTVISKNTVAPNVFKYDTPSTTVVSQSQGSSTVMSQITSPTKVVSSYSDQAGTEVVTTPGSVSVAVQPVTTYSPVSISTTPSVTIVPGRTSTTDATMTSQPSSAANPVTTMSTIISESRNLKENARMN